MPASALNAVTERMDDRALTFGDFLAAVSEVAQEDAAEVLESLFACGRVRFVDAAAFDRLASLSRPLPSAQRAARASRARVRNLPSRRATRAN
jgi:hypothetical protein